MASEKPVIVSKVGWFAELPDDACLKVEVDYYEEETLLQYMIALSSNAGLRDVIGLNAQNHVIREYNPDKIAQDYYSFMESILSDNEYLINSISWRLYDLCINEEDSSFFRYAAERIKELFQGV
jgi:hypothetical protein